MAVGDRSGIKVYRAGRQTEHRLIPELLIGSGRCGTGEVAEECLCSSRRSKCLALLGEFAHEHAQFIVGRLHSCVVPKMGFEFHTCSVQRLIDAERL